MFYCTCDGYRKCESFLYYLIFRGAQIYLWWDSILLSIRENVSLSDFLLLAHQIQLRKLNILRRRGKFESASSVLLLNLSWFIFSQTFNLKIKEVWCLFSPKQRYSWIRKMDTQNSSVCDLVFHPQQWEPMFLKDTRDSHILGLCTLLFLFISSS